MVALLPAILHVNAAPCNRLGCRSPTFGPAKSSRNGLMRRTSLSINFIAGPSGTWTPACRTGSAAERLVATTSPG